MEQSYIPSGMVDVTNSRYITFLESEIEYFKRENEKLRNELQAAKREIVGNKIENIRKHSIWTLNSYKKEENEQRKGRENDDVALHATPVKRSKVEGEGETSWTQYAGTEVPKTYVPPTETISDGEEPKITRIVYY